MDFFATCPTGFEQLLADELRALGIARVRPLKGQASFEGTLRDAYRVCLWSRLASRVIAVLARIDAHDSDALYEGLHEIAWESHLPRGASFAIDAHGTNQQLRNTQFVALRSKDALMDRLLARTGARALTDTARPDLTVSVRISRERATVGIDLAGEPLFRRGYEGTRRAQGALVPLRPDYAAALLMAGGWQRLAHEGARLLIPFVGSGNSAVEAAGMALDRAPGLARARWGFAGWAAHEPATWDSLVDEAQGRNETQPSEFALVISDLRPGFDSATRQALRSAGMHLAPQVLGADDVPLPADGPQLLACDLSWLDPSAVALQAGALARTTALVEEAGGSAAAAVLSPDELPDAALGTPDSICPTMLGRTEASIRCYHHPSREDAHAVTLPTGDRVATLVATSDQFAARLVKNARLRRKWARREDVSCYRIYDADLPDYAVSLDLFEGSETPGRWLQVYEYAPPKSVDAVLARSRLLDVVAIAPKLLGVAPGDVFVRVRTKARGGSQYADEAQPRRDMRRSRTPRGRVPLPPGAHLVDEGGLTFEVNFSSRLDCGIFLDHRDTRAMLRELAKTTKGSKRFLNLFAYTGTGTCYAADGGMRHTTTVDLSRPSLDWARRNMERNGFAGPEHEFVQADVIGWVSEQRHTKNRWDLVFCDVPTFSNSSRMRTSSFDVQRDHAELLISVSRLLTREGVCVFSCNLRTFRLDDAALAKAGVVAEDITARTIPEDFARNPKIHHCYLVRRTPRA